MVQDQGIEVYLAPYSDISKRYPEHAVPTTSSSLSGKPNEVYIEAVDGERFVIVVDLLKDFDAKGCQRLRIAFNTGGKWVSHLLDLSASAKRIHDTPQLQGRDVIHLRIKKIDGSLVRHEFKFAELKIGTLPTSRR